MARPRRQPDLEAPGDGAPPRPLTIMPHWRRAPCATYQQQTPATRLTPDELATRIDAYFTECADNGVSPTYCDMAAVIGFSSLVEMMNHTRRQPKVMTYISRGLLAVAAGYESATANGLRTGAFLLERLQGFDPAEPPAQRREDFFTPTKEVNLNITGVQRQETMGAELTPLEAYQRMIKFKTHQEAVALVGEVVEGDFVEIKEE